MAHVRPKKHLGQHFLKDEHIAEKIVESLTGHGGYKKVLEIGPGTGVLTQFLVKKDWDLTMIDLDNESIDYLKNNYQDLKDNIIFGDFLKEDLGRMGNNWAIIGNFPYNISSQIFFRVLNQRDEIPEIVGMLQKEVAERITAKEGSKIYGILSVLLGAFYDREYLFTVPPEVFDPPPKVQSAVVRLKRNKVKELPCDEAIFKRVVKQGFQNRRKTLRNALKPLNLPTSVTSLPIMDQRAEQLSVDDFISLTLKITTSD